jgi:hypothetical protein
MKSYKFVLPVIIVALIFLLFKLFTPELTNWNQSFSKNDKIPYGSYILYENLNQLLQPTRHKFCFKSSQLNQLSLFENLMIF